MTPKNPYLTTTDLYERSQVLPPPSEFLRGAWDKILRKGERLLYTEYSALWIIHDATRIYTLDRLAALIKYGVKGITSTWGIRIGKKDVEGLAIDLRSQAKKLRNLAQSYELIATALSVGIEDFDDIVEMDKNIKNARSNPF